MSRLFISHSSRNDDWAIALRDWLVQAGWSGSDDIFLDLDPERGIAAGQRWMQALEDATARCEAVLFVVSEEWLASKWCIDEYQLANRLNKKLFALLTGDIALERLPGVLSAQWQVVHLKGEPVERFVTIHPRTGRQSPIYIAEAGLKSLKRGLERAGIGPETFDLYADANEPFGWRLPYRGLEALEPEDAAVFFGRSADIVRGIDALRGLATGRPSRPLVILGASGSGKSSFLRAGLWPRLLRDDRQWLPLKTIRASRGGAIEGNEGLLAALEEVHRRFSLRASRAVLRQHLTTTPAFVALLRDLRQAAARRVLLSVPPYPLPVLCLDQGEELFAEDAGAESEKLLHLVRAAIDSNEALLLVTIRSDSYGLMQGAKILAGIDQLPLSLGPVPHGEIARIIREPSEVLRRKVGPGATVFDPTVVERLQAEIAGEVDALPLLAFALQRLMREHTGTATIGVNEFNQTGGVAAAIEHEAQAAFEDAGYGPDVAQQRDILRRLFIPRLARIDRESQAAKRRVAFEHDLPADLLPLARALTERRLLVTKLAADGTSSDSNSLEAGTATLEVAHEALLRRWRLLADILTEDRDALLLLESVRLAAAEWNMAEAARKSDFLVHHGSRLSAAHALATRGSDWAHEVAPTQAYLTACTEQPLERAESERRERLTALGGLVAGVAHEVNNPVGVCLTVASSFARHATQFKAESQLQMPLPSQLEEFMHICTDAAQQIVGNLHRIAELVQSFKQVAVDRSHAVPKLFDLKEATAQIVHSLRPVLKRRPIALTINIPEGLVVNGFPGSYGQALTNLFLNAVNHAFTNDRAGTISIDAWSRGRDEIEIIFSDDGEGMTPDVLRQAFDPFFTTRREEGGTGLGLHIVHMLITEQMGGQIVLESELNRGTRFRIRLPVVAPKISSSAKAREVSIVASS